MLADSCHGVSSRFLGHLLAVALCLGCHAPERRPPDPGSPFAQPASVSPPGRAGPGAALTTGEPSTTVTRLPSGMLLVLRMQPAAPVVALQAWVTAGATAEPADQAGIAHLCERMILATRHGAGPDPQTLAQEVDALGGDFDAYTTLDQTVFSLTVASRYLDSGIGLLAEALRRPAFPPAELHGEAQSVVEEIHQADATPLGAATQALRAAAFPRHPYHRSVLGSERSVLALTPAQLHAFHEHHYGPAHLTLVLTGDFDAAQARLGIDRAFGGGSASRSTKPAKAAREPTQGGLRVTTLQREGRESAVLLGFHGPRLDASDAADAADAAAMNLLAVLLGAGEEARLRAQVQHNRQAASEVFAYSLAPRDPGLLVVGALFPPPQLGEAATALVGETLRLAHEEVSPAELSRARGLLERDEARQRETAAGVARRLGFFVATTGGLQVEEAYRRALREMTPARLRAVAARYLVPQSLTVAVVQPPPGPPPAPHGRARPRSRAQLLVDAVTPEAAQVEPMLRRIVAQAVERLEAAPGVVAMTSLTDGGPRARAPWPVVEHRLRNGTRVLIVPERGASVVALRALWAGGLRFEDEHSAGADHLLARLLTRGTRTRDEASLGRELREIGATLSGSSGYSSFGLQGEVPGQHIERGLQLFADCLLNPAFAEGAVDDERRAALAELRAKEDDPAQVALRLFTTTLYPHHPYRHDVLGTTAAVSALSRRRLQEFYRRHYPLSRATLVIVGAVAPAAMIAALEALLPPAGPASRDDLAPGPEAPAGEAPEVPPPLTAPVQVFKYLDKPQGHLVMGFRGATVRSPDRLALEVLLTVLTGPGGRLRAALTERQPLAYRVGSYAVDGLDPGFLAFSLSASPDKIDLAQAALRDELRRLCDHGISDEELGRARRYLIGVHDTRLSRRQALAEELGRSEVYGLGWAEAGRYAERLQQLGAAQVQEVARRYLDERGAVLAAVLQGRLSPAAQRQSGRGEPERAPARKAAKAGGRASSVRVRR